MRYENNFYRTSDSLLDIEFLFVDRGTHYGWRAYILTPINYKQFSKSRSDSVTTIHRLTEGDSEMLDKIRRFKQSRGDMDIYSPVKYICWKHTVPSLERMREIAKTWSEITAYYIRNGGTFETIQPQLKKKGIISI